MHILPPARAKIGNSTLMMPPSQDGLFVTAWGVVHDVAAPYRYRRSIASDAKRNMSRCTSLAGWGVCVGVSDGRTPFFYFDRKMVSAWLGDGGRAWIIAELEARSTRRVVAFPRNGGRS
jgi:hypothetical protein